MNTLKTIITKQAQAAKNTLPELRRLNTDTKNQALHAMADILIKHSEEILTANAQDLTDLPHTRPNANQALKNRLILTKEKITAIAASLRAIAALPDPVGEILGLKTRPNGLRIGKMRTPMGVLCCIYESRPNVTADIAGLALKSGNACILRGGRESIHSNTTIARILKQAIQNTGVNPDYLQMIEQTGREGVTILAQLDQYIDLIIPRGGEKLIDVVSQHAKMPVLKHRKGICHLYADADANHKKAIDIIVNAKAQNPSTCNSLEKALIHEKIADTLLPELVRALTQANVEVRGCERTQKITPSVTPATDADWSTEYLDLKITLKIVKNFDEAVKHIEKYGTGLADGIITENYTTAGAFLQTIDSANVFVNASTRFADGFEYGLGAEVGISTAKIHGRGPMGLEDLTVTKYIVLGNGQTRK
ncbi:MAG: glutamate-5-semialdehyde dehydrogenase [Candidatus Kerfeldbacteria bacterium RIFCSPHIGHO2_12_FULL_48_17]|uniref:Gamma-glutamyl phosphate reductase n=1 Tax=Candidatus Kerfeldbacteria bacterium RIFCSPHIGHO2_12_FULL_48_17 TaxID=1798542 RepID=A0A1G2B2R8_9BACT|nr:MAG: glutamate-5-semialdehyde dehydrogenase [Candidatus Kerfeldbacteria bacterium RIFCSPHIGHO2_12_FULL_48_17]